MICSLVPNSGIQFLDYMLPTVRVTATRRRFIEETAEDGAPSLNVANDDGGAIYHPVTNEPCDPASAYLVNGEDAIEAFLGQWLPIPFMRVSASEDGSDLKLDEGPSNWTRVLITRAEEPDGGPAGAGYRVVVAIDTAATNTTASGGRGYTCPTVDDVCAGTAFRFSDEVNDVAWFVSEAWVDEWVKTAFGPATARDHAAGLRHLACYLTLLGVLHEGCELPALSFLPATAVGTFAETVPVDLALDFGTSRLTAVIAERASTTPSASRQGTAIRPLQLRHLSAPWRLSAGPLPGDVAFHRADFGSEALSRWSGRANAFYWPSLVRTGAEGRDILQADGGNRSSLGVASPIVYIWDERPSQQVWRFAGPCTTQAAAADSMRRNPVVSGTLLAHLSDTGELVEDGASQVHTTKPRFSRSSLLTLQIAELLLQTLPAINAPQSQRTAPEPTAARRLERLVITPPSGMGEASLALLRRRAEAAIKLVWKAMGWAGDSLPMAPSPPAILMAVDTGTASQLAWLENEIGHKFGGKPTGLMNLLGKARSGYASSRTLRIATVDIGSASSCLAVSTYEPVTGNGLAVSRQLIDGSEIGVDSILQSISRTILLPALTRRLAECRHADAAGFFRALLSSDDRGRPTWVGDLGRRLAADVLGPAAWTLLQLSSGLETDAGEALSEETLGRLVASAGANAGVTFDKLDVAAADDGADGFSPADVMVSYANLDIAEITRSALAPWIGHVVRIVRALDCDLVLLTGSGAGLRPARDAILSGMPLRPDRIVSLPFYRFADWLPAGDAWPLTKCLPAVGALVQARGSFSHGGPDIILRGAIRASEALFVGRLSSDDRLPAENVLFDLSARDSASSVNSGNSVAQPTTAAITCDLPVLIGARSTSLTQSPARPLWQIERSGQAEGRPPKQPVKLTLGLVPAARGRPMELKVVSAVDRDGSRLAPDDFAVRMQTQTSASGRWLDTGHLLDPSVMGATP